MKNVFEQSVDLVFSILSDLTLSELRYNVTNCGFYDEYLQIKLSTGAFNTLFPAKYSQWFEEGNL